MRQVEIKRGFASIISAIITDADGNKFNISQFDGVKFCMFSEDDNKIIDYQDGEITEDVDNTIVSYRFKSSETNIPGTYKAMFVLTENGLPSRSIPERDFYEILITNNPTIE